MYVFERAYQDYWARLRAFVAWALGRCRVTWDWFWEGPGAEVIKVLVYVAIAVGGLLQGVLYYVHARQQEGFSLPATLLVCVIIVGASWLLFWGWKLPAYVTVRAVSGAAAGGAVGVLGLLAFTAALVVFSAYLVLLATLTALSFLVFLPLRASQALWLLYRRIAYHCPYDDCPYRGQPIHICSCGALYPDLLPSFYGLFHHTCRHGDRDVRLPTLDVLGRGKLPRLCGGCRRPLVHSSLGELPVWPVALVGGPAAGKTVFLRQVTRALCQGFGGNGAGTVRIDAADQARELEGDLRLLDRGQVPAKTAGDVHQAFGLAVRLQRPRPLRCLLYLYDAPGEVFARMESLGRKQSLSHLSGVVLLIDPFALPGLAAPAGRATTVPLADLLSNLIHRVDALRGAGPGAPCPVPLAVVLSKADALPVHEFPFLAGLCPAAGDTSARCREALARLGAANGIRALEMRFRTVRYFACSGLGRAPDPRDATPFRPVGVTDPLLWILDQNGGAARAGQARPSGGLRPPAATDGGQRCARARPLSP
jgi:hypothetical protein